MNWLKLAASNLLLSPLASAVNVLLMTLGTASIVLLILAGDRLSDTLSRDARGVDLVIGAQGSPAQLILSAVYHADIPPGNIPLRDAEVWGADSRIELAAPVSLGDSFRGFRIVGTTPTYLELFNAAIAEGELWQEPMQAVIGAGVARTSRMGIGDEFSGVHGFSEDGHVHDEQVYRIVGVLEPLGTVVDRLILTSLESVWELHGQGHEHHDHDDAEHDHDHDHDHDHEQHEAEHDHGDEGHDHEHHETDQDHDHSDHDHEQHEAEHVHNNGEHDHEHHETDHDHDHADHDHEQHEAEHDHDDGEHDHEHHETDHDHDHADHDHEQHEAEHDHDDGEHDHEHHETDHDHTDHDHEHEHAGNHDHNAASPSEDLEVTAMLLRYRTPLAATSLPREVNSSAGLQAAAPAMEIARILQLVGLGLDGLRAFAWVLIVTACLSVFAALYGSLRSRRGDLAMLRCLGATRFEVFIAMMSEGMILSLIGIALGYSLGHGAIAAVGAWLEASRGVNLSGASWVAAESQLLLVLLGVSVLSAALPSLQAYRTDVARTLADGGQ